MRYVGHDASSLYVKKTLFKTSITADDMASLDKCVRFVYVNDVRTDTFDGFEMLEQKKGITNCKEFINEIRNGQTVKEAGFYELLEQPDGSKNNAENIGYIYGFIQDDLNVAILLRVYSYADKAYSVQFKDGVEYVLSQEWFDKLS